MYKVIQLFECQLLSVKELVTGVYFFSWNLLSFTTVILNLWAVDPGGTLKLLKRFSKPTCTFRIVSKQNKVMCTHTHTHTLEFVDTIMRHHYG